MSAFIVGVDHIDALMTFAAHYRDPVSYFIPETGNRVEITPENATKIGRILIKENERSVNHRYNENEPSEADNYNFRPLAMAPSALVILKCCDCFDYQACETDD